MKSPFSILIVMLTLSAGIAQTHMNLHFGIGYELLYNQKLKFQHHYFDYVYHSDTTDLVIEYVSDANAKLTYANPTNLFLGYTAEFKSYKRFHLSIGTMWNLKKYTYTFVPNLSFSNGKFVSQKIERKITYIVDTECDSTIISSNIFNRETAVIQHAIQIPLALRYQINRKYSIQTKFVPGFTVIQKSNFPAFDMKIDIVNGKKICTYFDANNKQYTYQYSNPTIQFQLGGRYDYNKWIAFEGNFTFDFKDILNPQNYYYYKISRFPSKPIGIQVLAVLKL